MRSSTMSLLLFAVIFAVMLVAPDARAQSEPKQSTGPAGSISGRVTLDGKPAPGVKVVAFKGASRSQEEPVASAKTDQDGNFQLNKLPSDHYRILPLTPAYIASEQTELLRPGKPVRLAEGETIEGLDFALIRGGVITGRITSEDGQPITGEMVTLVRLDPNGRKRSLDYFTMLPYDFGADDQGIYRIFGLPPGRYLVSAGKETDQGPGWVRGLRYHRRTFYPGVADESKAGLVELNAGTVATDIDITLGHTVKTYSASGRVIDAITGRPSPNAQLGYGMTREDTPGRNTSSFSDGLQADARGSFQIDGLMPGTFYVMATPDAESGKYSNVASFQIKDQDITGLEIKIGRGSSSISGVLAVEGANDPEVIARLSQLKLLGSVSSPDAVRGANTSRISDAGPDGGFIITGLRPGKAHLNLLNNRDAKGFSVLRVERGGVEYRDGIEVGPGEHVTDVRVILGYASGRIRGQVKIEGGKLPPDAEISISVGRVDGRSQQYPRVVVDPNGRFVVEDLTTGEYKISVSVFPPFSPDRPSRRPLTREVTKRVSVARGAESEVLLVVELIAKDKDQ